MSFALQKAYLLYPGLLYVRLFGMIGYIHRRGKGKVIVKYIITVI